MLNLAALTAAFVLTGNQAINLDLTHTLGTSITPTGTFSLVSEQQRENNKWAAIAVALDWPIDAELQKGSLSIETLRKLAQEYCSYHPSHNQLHFLELYTQAWQTNWVAGPTELGVLKRLILQNSTAAEEFAEKLRSNPTNQPITLWQDWYNLILNRDKAHAAQFAQEHTLDTTYSCSSSYPLTGSTEMQILGLSHNQLLIWQYSPSQTQWFPRIAPQPANPPQIMDTWPTPTDTYYRTWQTGPSWQVTYCSTNGILNRTATFCKSDCYIYGHINQQGLTEEIIQSDTPVTITQTQQRVQIVH